MERVDVIRLGFHLMEFQYGQELTSCQLDGFLMNWCSRDHVDQPRFCPARSTSSHSPATFAPPVSALAPFDTVAIVVASFQNIQLPQLKRASCGWAILWIAKSQPMIFIARLIIGTEPIGNGCTRHTRLSHHGGHGDLRADPAGSPMVIATTGFSLLTSCASHFSS